MDTYLDDLPSPFRPQAPLISQNEDEPAQGAPSAPTAVCSVIEPAAPIRPGPAVSSEQDLPAAIHPPQKGVEGQASEIFVCQFKRCKRKRERRGKPDARFLFAAEWREMKIGALMVWVVDLTARCPDCTSRRTVTLIPPVISPALPKASLVI